MVGSVQNVASAEGDIYGSTATLALLKNLGQHLNFSCLFLRSHGL